MDARGAPVNPYLEYLEAEHSKTPRPAAKQLKNKSKSATRAAEDEDMVFVQTAADPQTKGKPKPLKQIGRVFGFISNKSNKPQKRQRSARFPGAEKKEKKKEARWEPDRQQRMSLAKMSSESLSIQQQFQQFKEGMGTHKDDLLFGQAIPEDGDEEEVRDGSEEDAESGSNYSTGNPVEPYFTLLNCPDYFKIVCSTLDFDDQALKPKPLNGKTLIIKKEGCLIYEEDASGGVDEDLQNVEPHNQFQHHGILGVLNLFDTELFLVLVTACTPAGRCPRGHQIHQISQVDFIPFFSKIEADGKQNPPLHADVIKQLKGVQKLLEEQYFYFSYYSDISSNQERQSIERAAYQAKNHKSQDILWWRRPKNQEAEQVLPFDYDSPPRKEEEAKESEQIEQEMAAQSGEDDGVSVKTMQGYERQMYHMDIRYVWNWGLLRDFQYQKVDPFWTVVAVQGYFSHHVEVVDLVTKLEEMIEDPEERGENAQPIEVTIFSRRRSAMGGVRLICRGVDDNSNCGNFVETETILSTTTHVYSFVQVRGSIPLYWEQKQHGLVTEINILRSLPMTAKVFDAHLLDLLSSYKKVLLINLVRKNKPEEDKLTQGLVQLLKMAKQASPQPLIQQHPANQMNGQANLHDTNEQIKQNVKHIWFDFHAETSGDKFHKLNDLMDEIDAIQQKFGYFVRERYRKRRVLQIQQGIFRTNCIDCLDRTNVTQTKICLRTVEQILYLVRSISEISQGRKNCSPAQIFSDAMASFNGPVDHQQNQIQTQGIQNSIRQVWAKNGDVISIQYTGTESNISRVTTKNKQGVVGKLEQWQIGINRYYQHLTHDQFKQACVETLTDQQRFDDGQCLLSDQIKPYGFQGLLQAQMKEMEVEPSRNLSQKKRIRIGVLAINAQNFEDEDDQVAEKNDSKRIGKILNEYISGDSLDVISIGMTFGGLFVTENEDGTAQKGRDKSRFIEEMLEDFNNLSGQDRDEKLVAVCFKQKQQQLVFVFAKQQLVQHITDVSPLKQANKKAESGNVVANLSFRLYGHKFLFQFHNAKTLRRKLDDTERKDFAKYFRSELDEARSFEFLMIRNDNLCIDLPDQEIDKLVDDFDFETLQKHDQFSKVKQSMGQPYEEAIPKFNPMKQSARKNYQWPLRIMHKSTDYAATSGNLKQVSYRKIQGADFAVFSIYDVRVEEINVQRWCQLRDKVADAIVDLKDHHKGQRLPSQNQLRRACRDWSSGQQEEARRATAAFPEAFEPQIPEESLKTWL